MHETHISTAYGAVVPYVLVLGCVVDILCVIRIPFSRANESLKTDFLMFIF